MATVKITPGLYQRSYRMTVGIRVFFGARPPRQPRARYHRPAMMSHHLRPLVLVEQMLRETDWQKIDAQSDADIARNVASDPDAAPILNEAETASAIARSTRKRLGLSQVEFAARFHVPIGTLRDWEQNRKQPDAPALAYLRVIAKAPDMVAEILA